MAVYKQYQVDIPKEKTSFHRRGNGLSTLIEYTIEAPYDRKKGYATPKRVVIGHLVEGSHTKMHPTTNFKTRFPEVWKEITGKTVSPSTLKIGLFTALEAINYKTGLKDMLDSIFGVEKADALIDYSLYSILHHSDSTSHFTDGMEEELLYSRKPKSDSFYSSLFEQGFLEEELSFKKERARYCASTGVDKVWLFIDGSNLDCTARGVELAEKGHAKSGKNVNIISFTYAVTENGMPVTWSVYRGSLVDARAIREIIHFLEECGIQVEGVVLDRGYCSSNMIDFLIRHKLEYLIMCKANSTGFKEMVLRYGSQIRLNMAHWVFGTKLFAIQQPVQAFQNYEHQDWMTLFFDLPDASDRIEAFLGSLGEEIERLEEEIKAGKKAAVDEKHDKWLKISTKDGVQKVELKEQAAQEVIDKKGFYAIISSQPLTPREINALYYARSASEVQFRQIKTQLGYKAIRVHFTAAVKAKFTEAFLSSIIRWEIEMAAKAEKLGLNTNHMIAELDKIRASKINDVYIYNEGDTSRIEKYFAYFNLNSQKLIEQSIKLENDRLAGRVWAPRKRKTGPKKGSHHKQYDEQGREIRKKGGVPKGTKRSAVNKDGTPRKKPGVPKGTKRPKFNKDGSLRKKPGPKKVLQPAD